MKIKARIWLNKYTGQKFVTVPKNSDLEAGDEVWIERAEKKTCVIEE
jgi:hypothetical protein